MENKVSNYRPRKKVVSDCLEQGAITETEAKALNKAISKSDNSFSKGRELIDLKPFELILNDRFKQQLEKGTLSDKQLQTLHLVRLVKISKPHLVSVAEVDQCLQKLVEIAVEDNQPLLYSSIALALGITTAELKNIESGIMKCPSQEVIKQYIQLVATQNEERIFVGNGTGAMFLGKNHFGLNDTKSVEVKEVKQEMTDAELEEHYKSMDIVDVVPVDKDKK